MTPDQRTILEHLIEDHLIKNYIVEPTFIGINHIYKLTPGINHIYKLTPLNKNKQYKIEMTFDHDHQLQEPGIQVTYINTHPQPSPRQYSIVYEYHTYDIANPNYEQHILEFIKKCEQGINMPYPQPTQHQQQTPNQQTSP